MAPDEAGGAPAVETVQLQDRMTTGTAQLGSPAACLVRFHPALRRSALFLAASTVGILDVIQIDNRTGAFFLAFLVCPALLVIVTKYCDDPILL